MSLAFSLLESTPEHHYPNIEGIPFTVNKNNARQYSKAVCAEACAHSTIDENRYERHRSKIIALVIVVI